MGKVLMSPEWKKISTLSFDLGWSGAGKGGSYSGAGQESPKAMSRENGEEGIRGGVANMTGRGHPQ